jgi:hypothetical protein
MSRNYLALTVSVVGYGILWSAIWTGLNIVTRRFPPFNETAYFFSYFLAWAAMVRLWWELGDVR